MALRILVVDHNPERAAIVRQALVDVGGFMVEVAPKAGDLLTLLRTAQPDVLVVDLDLPDRDDRDVQLAVLPPPYMADALAKGQLHGFCVGAPWASVAVAQGHGHILHFGVDLIARCPEKVLAVRSTWAATNARSLQRLVRACARAAAWCAVPENRPELAQILAGPKRLAIDPETIARILEGRLMVAPDGETRAHGRFFLLDGFAALRLTVRTARLIRMADIIIHDPLVDAAILELARGGAIKVPAGGAPDWDERAQAGKIVVRLRAPQGFSGV